MFNVSCFPGQDCLSNLKIAGPSVLDVDQLPDPWVDLTCSFHYSQHEYKELDLKWYFSTDEEPFLQWVPSSGRKPQTIGQRFKNRLEVRHSATNNSEGVKLEQIIHAYFEREEEFVIKYGNR